MGVGKGLGGPGSAAAPGDRLGADQRRGHVRLGVRVYRKDPHLWATRYSDAWPAGLRDLPDDLHMGIDFRRTGLATFGPGAGMAP